jgi:hypothetical protein
MSQMTIRRPFLKIDLRDKQRLHPTALLHLIAVKRVKPSPLFGKILKRALVRA